MSETSNIIDLKACGNCLRGNYDRFKDFRNPENAAAYLLSCAVDGSNTEGLEVDGETWSQASEFLNGSAPNPAKGAVGHCGRKIGKGDCPSWELAVVEEVPVIVSKSS